ncbi:hypothetical protein GGU10DRAFT_361760 [Lentinula aff. detonsa]|uniref:Uncharacterized protein n=1 Tax=Lentinula aff. detonsa TaxID=2804958 RepID=A0AA38NC84_9AGAR|nr:hypothetical protein GGU10DRAFT_361760 [Lentinula aff. detonsa]
MSSYFLLIEIVTIASSSVNLLLGNIPDVSAGTRAQFFDLLLTLSSFAVFFLLYETLITRCIWSTSKHLLNCDELRGIHIVSFPRRWLCRVLSPPDYLQRQHATTQP